MHRLTGFSLILLVLLPALAVGADTVVSLGQVDRVDGPDVLGLSGNVIYAVDNGFAASAVSVNGVPFLTTNDAVGSGVPGLTISGAPSGPLGFGGPYTFSNGTPADNAALSAVMSEIQCCSGADPAGDTYSFAVAPGGTYEVQVLWGENITNNRVFRNWDIEIEGILAVDQVYSQGLELAGVVADPNDGNATRWMTTILEDGDGLLDIRFGQLGGLPHSTQFGNDANYIVSAFIITQIPEPASIAIWSLIGLGLAGFGYFRYRRKR